MRSLFIALLLAGLFSFVVRADDFHFGEPNGASLGAKIESGRLVYALKNSTNRSWKYMVRMAAQVPMYDNLILMAIDEDQVVHRFGFVDSRDACGPVYKTLAPGELYQESIDLPDWSRRNAKNKGFSFQEGKSYRIYLNYFWIERNGTAQINYGPLDSRLFKITLKDGVFSEGKE